MFQKFKDYCVQQEALTPMGTPGMPGATNTMPQKMNPQTTKDLQTVTKLQQGIASGQVTGNDAIKAVEKLKSNKAQQDLNLMKTQLSGTNVQTPVNNLKM